MENNIPFGCGEVVAKSWYEIPINRKHSDSVIHLDEDLSLKVQASLAGGRMYKLYNSYDTLVSDSFLTLFEWYESLFGPKYLPVFRKHFYKNIKR